MALRSWLARVGLLGFAGFAVVASSFAHSPLPAIEKRFALVIGNGAYANSPLRNPVNDARAMTQTLKGLSFDVIARENAGEKDMRRAIFEFGDKFKAGGVGLFFFAGHSVQVGGRNFLVPIGAEINSERDVELEAVDPLHHLDRMGPRGVAGSEAGAPLGSGEMRRQIAREGWWN